MEPKTMVDFFGPFMPFWKVPFLSLTRVMKRCHDGIF